MLAENGNGLNDKPLNRPVIGGLAGWLMGRLRGGERQQPRLQLLERITLAPRQSLALVEAEGRKLLVATSADSGPAFYPLDERVWAGAQNSKCASRQPVRRVSW